MGLLGKRWQTEEAGGRKGLPDSILAGGSGMVGWVLGALWSCFKFPLLFTESSIFPWDWLDLGGDGAQNSAKGTGRRGGGGRSLWTLPLARLDQTSSPI